MIRVPILMYHSVTDRPPRTRPLAVGPGPFADQMSSSATRLHPVTVAT